MFNYRLYFIALTASIGAFLFGYDTGFIGAAVTLDSFKRDFGFTAANSANLQANIVATLQAGCFFGTVFMSIGAKWIGRTRAMCLAAFVFDIGAVLQTVTTGSLGMMYAGRIISGLGIGAATILVPSYLAEISPREIRGKLTMIYAFTIFFAIMSSYWIDYGCKLGLSPDGHLQWRIPVALQLVFGTLLLVGSLFLKESPRWLITRGRNEEALKVLAWVQQKSIDHGDVLAEYTEIYEQNEKEMRECEGVTWRELMNPKFRNQIIIAFWIEFSQQFTGTNTFTYFAPTLFQDIGLSSSSSSLFATGIYGILKVIFSMISLLFVVDRVGRRPPLIIGSCLMGTWLLLLGIIWACKPPVAGASVSGASIAMMVMVYLYAITYSMTWGPIPFSYLSETAPNRIRSYVVGIGIATNWAFNYCLTRTVPLAMANIKWRTFIMFAVFNYSICIASMFFVRETKNYPLEEIEQLFRGRLILPVKQALKIFHPKYDEANAPHVPTDDASVKGEVAYIEKKEDAEVETSSTKA
ncbi:general substrate transporter [Dipodascopsis tothii]|uniref:general substrate transporter n=1 Tax=Dipodascopsis tothii TaxID=44089 RepID=UPI0034CD42D6